jgi:hypothetical protein
MKIFAKNEPVLDWNLVRRINEIAFDIEKKITETGGLKKVKGIAFKKSEIEGYDAFYSDGKVLRFVPDYDSNFVMFYESDANNLNKFNKALSIAPNYSQQHKAGNIDFYSRDIDSDIFFNAENGWGGKVELTPKNIKEAETFVEKVVKCFENLFD